VNLERQPRQVPASQVIALGTSFAALALLGSDELLEFPMQLLDLPTHGVLVLNVVQSELSVGITLLILIVWVVLIEITISDDPLNVAVRGDHLEEAHEKRHLLEIDQLIMPQSILGPFQRV
jgi:hypothetical protein